MARASALGSGEGEVTAVIGRACRGLWSHGSADGASESGQPLPAPIVWSACDAGIAIAAEVGCSIGQKTLSPLQTNNVVATITGTTPSGWLADTLIPAYAINRPVTVQSRSGIRLAARHPDVRVGMQRGASEKGDPTRTTNVFSIRLF